MRFCMPDLNDAPDLDATVPVAGPTPSAGSTPRLTVNLPLPEDLAKLLPEGTYTVQSFLGQGGMGAVYRGTQVRLQRQVAIKIMCRDQGRDHGFEERFRREALALAQLNHPNIVNVIDYGEAGPDYLYIVMEFVDGTDLVGVIRSGQMTQETALKLLPQICDALQFAHDNGIVHRDIKPANILLTRDGRIKMADFGLAKRFDVNSTFQTQTGAGMGTPDYAAPEQFDPNGNVDHRADIYALGVMIYQMVTGQLPRGAWKPPSEKADVDAHWDKIVSHALQTDPSDRYASVSEIKSDISSILLPISGQGAVTGSAVSRKSGFSGTLGGSTSVLTQAGGRSATMAQAPAPPRSKKPLLFGLAGALMIAAGGYFAWDKFAAEVRPISVTNPAASATPALPPPIRLWDAADKLRKQPGVAWEDDALRLDDVEVARVFPLVQRLAVKTSIRVNPDTEGVKLGLKQRSRDEGTYFLYVDFANANLALLIAGQDKQRHLKLWKMPRQYRPGEWLPVELRVVDGEISVSLEGKLLGTVRDSALSDFMALTLSGKPYAHFRDIEVVPLDPSWTNQPPAPSIPVSETMAETVQRPVPKPASWVDATSQVRDDVVQASAGAVQGDWLVLSKPYFTRMPDRKILRNAVVRMSFKGAAGMALRTSPTDFSYQCVLNTNRTLGLFSFDGLALTRVRFNKLVKLEPDFDLLAEHELVMAAEEDLISVWLDGRLMLSQRDSNLAQGRITVIFQAAGSNASLHPHVKKVEYADLGETPATPVEVAKPALPAPIRLWDAADKIPKQPGVAWEDDALRLDSVPVSHTFPVVHRVAVKTSIRVNPDTGGVDLNLLQRFRDGGRYFLTVDFAKSELSLGLDDASDKDRFLKVWKMPRQYRPGEWLPVELRVVDGEISVSLEGKLLGNVHDSTFSEFTVFSLWGNSYAHFRDIEVVPLDPSWIPVTVTVAETVQRPVPKPAAWVDATAQVRGAVVQAGAGAVQGDWLVLSKRYHMAHLDEKIFRDAAVRMSFKGVVSMALRTSSETNLSYRCVLGPDRILGLFCNNGLTSTMVHFNKRVKLEPDFDLLAEHELVMAAEEDFISVWLDGRLMLSQRDGNLAQGRISVIYSVPGNDDSLLPHVRKVEYADLGGTPAVPASQSAVSRTWQAPTPTVTVGNEWTNLIPHIQPQRDVIRGEWSVDAQGLHAKRAEWAICNIPVQDPGTDYDLRYQVTRGEGSHLAMFFAFRKGSTGGYVPIDYIGAGAEFADGQRLATLEDLTHLDMRDAATIKAKRKEWLPRGKACTVLLQVREQEVIVSVDGQEAFRWPAEWSKLQQKGGAGGSMFLDVTGGPIFGVGIFNCEAVFHSIEMRKVSAAPFGEPGSIPHLLTSPDYDWTAPVNLGPLVNSPNVDLGPMVSPDGLHLVFSSLREGEAELFECRRPSADEPWSKPSRVFPAIEEGHQDQPWMSPDELRLIYHATTGPGHHGKPTEGDIYFRQRPTRDQPWPPPVNLGSKINHPGHDVAVRLSNDERTLLFTSTRPGGQGTWDVWQAKRTSREALFDQAENIGSGLNTADADFHATFAADDRTLLFLRGSRDLNFCRLFMATPDAKGQYQTTALDFPISGKLHNPWLSADGRTLWFAWNGPGSVGDMDLWEIRRVPKAKTEPAAAGGSSITPANTTKDAPFTNTLGMKFVPVPITGGPTDGKRVLFSVWETRVQDYEAFVKETRRVWTKPAFDQAPDHAAVNMSWDDATAFCTWLTDREHKAGKLGAASRYRLPTDHEWSCAVGIAPQEDAAKSPAQKDRALVGLYPWGTAWPPPVNSGNYAGEEMIPAKVPGRHPSASPCPGYRDAYVETAPAGSFPANALGLHDLGGSVWEWCEEWYDDSKAEHVLRGCAYIAGDQSRMLSSARNPYRPTAAHSIYFGFRCVLVSDEGK
jgi:hypothetical protein